MLHPVYIDIHIHTSDNPNTPNDKYEVDVLVRKIREMAKDNPVLVSLTNHNMINKKALSKNLLKA